MTNSRVRFRAVLRMFAAAIVCMLAGSASRAQSSGSILIVSRPADGASKDTFVDLAPHLEPALREGGKLDPLAFRPDLPGVRALVQSGAITDTDLKPPLSRAAIHRIARALGARYVLTVSASSGKDGVVANAETEVNLTLDQWSTLEADRMVAGKMKGRALSLLESVHVLVAGLVEKVQTAITRGPGPTGTGDKPGVPRPSDSTTLTERGNGRPPTSGNSAPARAETKPPAGPKDPAIGGAANPVGLPAAPATPPRQVNAPSTYEILVEKARRNGDTANLLVALRRAVTEKPRDIRLRLDLVRAYRDRGWQDMARDEAGRAVSVAPTDSSLHRLLGESLMETGEADSALKELQIAVSLAPKEAAGYISLGDAYMSLGKPEEALKAYEDAAKADPKSAAPAWRLARYYGANGRYADCIAAIRTAKGHTSGEDTASFREDHAALMDAVHSTLAELLRTLGTTRVSFRNGTTTREATHKAVSARRKQAEDIAAFLDQIPDVGFARVQALYGQTATMIAQTAEKYLDYLETDSTAEDEEASLMRVEAAKQLADASKAMKAQLAAKK